MAFNNVWGKIFMVLLLVFAFVICISNGRLAEETEESIGRSSYEDLQCFHQELDACPGANESCRCKPFPKNKQAVICCDVNQYLLTEGLNCAKVGKTGNIVALHVRNATLDVLNVTQSSWRRLISMSFTDGHIDRVIGEFPKHSTVQCLNLSSNSIAQIEERALVNLYNLSSLDLSYNNITQVPRVKKDGVIDVDISHNQQMTCNIFFYALKHFGIRFLRGNETICAFRHGSNYWYNSIEYMTLTQISVMHQVEKECLTNCTCGLYRVTVVGGQPPIGNPEVNCTDLKLTVLPSKLPKNTFLLNVKNNSITSLDLINNDPSYQNLRMLYADDNQISSILSLEGTKFLSNFQVLSLRNNKLKSLPTYMLSNIFERFSTDTAPGMRILQLGHNYVHCDCHTAKVLKEWLLNSRLNIPDYNEIFCENMKKMRVIDLDSRTLCHSQADWTDYIYYIIGLEVLLLVFLIIKVSYDYWVFKTAGYLPWPANKMPKLPCDWLCE